MNCEKKKFECRKRAKQIARDLTKRQHKKYNVYKCCECHYFHLTSKCTIKNKVFFRNLKLRLQDTDL